MYIKFIKNIRLSKRKASFYNEQLKIFIKTANHGIIKINNKTVNGDYPLLLALHYTYTIIILKHLNYYGCMLKKVMLS